MQGLESLPELCMKGDILATEENMAKWNLTISLQQEIGLKLLIQGETDGRRAKV